MGSQLRFMADSSEIIVAPGDPGNSHEVGLLAALKNSSLRRFVGATLFWGTGHQLITVSQGYLLFELTDSTLWLAALGASLGIPTVIVAVLGGMLADRVSRTRLLITGSVIAGIPMVGVSVLYMTDALEPWHLLVAGAAQGSALALDWIARLSILPDMVPKNILVRAISIDQAVFNAARVLGPLIGGFLLGSVGPAASYGLIGGLFGLAILSYTTFRPHSAIAAAAHAGVVADLKEVAGILRSNTILRMNLMFTAVNALMLGGVVFIIPAFAKDVFATNEAGLGYLFTSIGTGAVAGAMTTSWIGGIRRAGWTLLLTDIVAGVFVILWATTTQLPFALVAGFIFGYFNAIHIAVGISAIQFNVPAEVRGRVIGAYELAWSGFPLGGLVSGSLATIFGLSASLAILGGGVIVFTLVVMAVSPQFRQLSISER
jgi:MFS family permease